MSFMDGKIGPFENNGKSGQQLIVEGTSLEDIENEIPAEKPKIKKSNKSDKGSFLIDVLSLILAFLVVTSIKFNDFLSQYIPDYYEECINENNIGIISIK